MLLLYKKSDTTQIIVQKVNVLFEGDNVFILNWITGGFG